MNDIKNDINLSEAVSRREQQLPPMPDDLNGRLMQRLQERGMSDGTSEIEGTATQSRYRRIRLYIAIAASILLIIGIGTVMQMNEAMHDEAVLAKETVKPMQEEAIPAKETVKPMQGEAIPVKATDKLMQEDAISAKATDKLMQEEVISGKETNRMMQEETILAKETVKPSPLNNRGYTQCTPGYRMLAEGSTLKECPNSKMGDSFRVVAYHQRPQSGGALRVPSVIEREPLHGSLAANGRQWDTLHGTLAAVGRQREPLYGSSTAIGLQREPLHGSSTAIGRQREPLYSSFHTTNCYKSLVPTLGSVGSYLAASSPSLTSHRELPDTLGDGIWQSEKNVLTALQMLSECEAIIEKSEQEMRNTILEATFNAMPQPANVKLVTNESGDYFVSDTNEQPLIEI